MARPHSLEQDGGDLALCGRLGVSLPLCEVGGQLADRDAEQGHGHQEQDHRGQPHRGLDPVRPAAQRVTVKAEPASATRQARSRPAGLGGAHYGTSKESSESGRTAGTRHQ